MLALGIVGSISWNLYRGEAGCSALGLHCRMGIVREPTYAFQFSARNLSFVESGIYLMGRVRGVLRQCAHLVGPLTVLSLFPFPVFIRREGCPGASVFDSII